MWETMTEKQKDRRRELKSDSVLHFPLGPLGGYPISALFHDERYRDLDELILALAHVYNDLKAALIFWEVNREFAAPIPETGRISKFFGQNVGLDNYAFRLQVGIVVELVQLLKEKKSVFSHNLWRQVLGKLSRKVSADWRKLFQLVDATAKKGSFEKRLLTLLVKIRSHGGYHYYQTKPFADGYLHHFSSTGPEAAHAYVCIGKNLEETRFFFADAAISSITNSWKADLGGNFDEEFRKYLKAIHSSIRTIVCTYFRVRKIPYSKLE